MTELDAILEDIRANPADDLPRLALADWLMERDDAASRSRGEFIHARCRAASLPPRDPEAAALRLRAEALRDEHEVEWLGGLAEHLDGWEFERGMIVAGVSHRSFLKGAFARLIACPGWMWVIGVRAAALSGRDLASLFKRSQFGSITSIGLRDSPLSFAGLQTGLRALSVSPHLARLVSLDLGYTRLGNGLHVLLGTSHLPALRILCVDGNGIADDGVRALAASTALPRLETLDLSRNTLPGSGINAFARSARFGGLRELRLSSCGIGNRGGIALAASTTLANLALLDLSDNPLDEATRAELRDRFGDRVILD